MRSCFYHYLLTGNPNEFEYPEKRALYFNDIVPVQLSWYDDPWTQLDWFLGAEDHLANLNRFHGPTNNIYYNGDLIAFPGHAWHRSNVPDAGHMPNLQLLEYYVLTGDHATLDAIRAMGCRAIATIFGYCYFAAGRQWDRKVVLDSVFIMPWQQRYIARPGLVVSHAYEVTGDDRYFWPMSIASYSLRNYTRQNPIGYMGKPDDRSYLPHDDPSMLAIWQENHPTDTDFPRSFHGNDFMIGIALECFYNYIKATRDEEIRDALIFSSKSMEWRAGMSGSDYLGFNYSGWADYLREGKRYSDVWSGGGSFTSSMSEAFGGFIFGYLVSGRSDLWPVIEDGRQSFPNWYPGGNTLQLMIIDMWEAYYKHDSLDNVPPAAVADLAVAEEAGIGVKLTWTAPGDDGRTGTAHEYQVKYAKAPIVDMTKRWNATDQKGWPDLRAPLPYTVPDLLAKAEAYKLEQEIGFWAATNVKNEPVPQAAGSSESTIVYGLDSNTEYYFALVTFDDADNVSGLSNVGTFNTGIMDGTAGPVCVLALCGNAPNPFNPATQIKFSVPGMKEERTRILLQVFNIQGQLVRTLVNTALKPGHHRTRWDGSSASDKGAASGIYILQLSTPDKVLIKKMMLVK
jgi:hypothetical protein